MKPGVALAAALALASACGNAATPGEERLIGVWESARGEVIELTRDGRIHTRDGANRQSGHWESIARDRIRIVWDRSEGTMMETAVTFTDEGQLVLTDVAPGVLYTPRR